MPDFLDDENAVDQSDEDYFNEVQPSTAILPDASQEEATYAAYDSTDTKTTYAQVNVEYEEYGESPTLIQHKREKELALADQYKTAGISLLEQADTEEDIMQSVSAVKDVIDSVSASANKIVVMENQALSTIKESSTLATDDKAKNFLASLDTRMSVAQKFSGVNAVFNTHINRTKDSIIPQEDEEVPVETRFFGNVIATVASSLASPVMSLEAGDKLVKDIQEITFKLPTPQLMASTLIPLQFTDLAIGVNADIFGSAKTFTDKSNILTGNFIEGLADYIKEAKTVEEQQARAEEVSLSILRNAGLGQNAALLAGAVQGVPASEFKALSEATSNKLIALEVLNAVKGYTTQEEEDREFLGVDWEKSLYNLIGVVDIVPVVGTTVSSFISLMRGTRLAKDIGRTQSSKSIAVLRDANPEKAAELEIEALTDAVKSANLEEVLDTPTSLNTTVDALLKDNLSHPLLDGGGDATIILQGASPKVMQSIKTQALEAREFIQNVPENTYAYRDTAYISRIDKLTKIFDEAEESMHAIPGASSIKRNLDNNRVDINMIYANTEDGAGFLNKQDADDFIQNIRTEKAKHLTDPKIDVVAYNNKTGLYTTSLDEVQDAEYFVRMSDQYIIGADDVQRMSDSDVMPSSAIGRYLLGPTEKMSPEIYSGASIAVRNEAFITKGLFSIARPFNKLGPIDKRTVNALLARGDESGQVFTPRELNRAGYTDKQQSGYYSARMFWDVARNIQESVLRTDLMSQGIKNIKVLDEQGELLFEKGGTLIDHTEAVQLNIKTIYDPKTSSSIAADAASITKLYKEGKTVVKLMSEQDGGLEVFDYIVIGGKGSNDLIEVLPQRILQDRTGYVMRVNTEPFYVKERVIIKRNGVDLDAAGNSFTSTPVRFTASSRKEANKLVAEMEADDLANNTKREYLIDEDRNIASSRTYFDQQSEALNSSSGFWFSKRGDRLVDGKGSTGRIKSPTEVMADSAHAVGSISGWAPFVRGLEKDIRILENTDISKLATADRRTLDKRIETLRDQLSLWKGQTSSFDKAFNESILSIANVLGSKAPFANKELTDLALAGKALNPFRAVTGSAAAILLFTKPLRQIMVQGSGTLHMVGINPKAMVRAYSEIPLLLTSLQARQHKGSSFHKATLKSAKLLGYSADEWTEVVEQFHKTGKVQAIDSNVWVSELMQGWTQKVPESIVGQAAHITGNAIKAAVVKVPKKIGFDFGEAINQATSWSFARHDHISKGGKAWNADRHTLDSINVKASNYGVDMTSSGVMKYSRGNLAALTQFWSITHKTFLNMVPDLTQRGVNFRGNRLLDDKRKAYILGTVAMFGLEGLGIAQGYQAIMNEAGITTDHPAAREINDIIKYGVTEKIFNKSLDLAFGYEDQARPSQVALSASIAPASGTVKFWHDLSKSLFGDKTVFEFFQGASASSVRSIYQGVKNVQVFYGAKDPEEELSLEFHIEGLSKFGEEFGFLKDITKLQAAYDYYERTERWKTNNKTRAGVDATLQELWAKALLGLGSRSEAEFWRKIGESKLSREQEKQLIKDISVQYMKLNNEQLALPEDAIEERQKIDDTKHRLFLFMSESNLARSVDLQSKVLKFVKEMPEVETFVEDLMQRTAIADPAARQQRLMADLRNSELGLTDEQTEALVQSLSSVLEGIDDLRVTGNTPLDDVFQEQQDLTAEQVQQRAAQRKKRFKLGDK